MTYSNRWNNNCKLLKDYLDRANKVYSSLKYKNDEVNDIYNDIKEYKDRLDYYLSYDSSLIDEDTYEELEDTVEELSDLVDDLLDEIDGNERQDFVNNDLGKFVLNSMFLNDERRLEDQKRKVEKLQKQIQDGWGLTDSEMEYVNEGLFNPWNFEHDDLEDGDYYKEDE